MMPHQLTITAELKHWRLDDERYNVEGIVHNSTSPNYNEGDIIVLLNFKTITHYPAYLVDPLHIEEHWIVKTQTNKYFILYKSQQQP